MLNHQHPLIIRDDRDHEVYWIDNKAFDLWLPIVGLDAFGIYNILCRFIDHECRLNDIALHVGISLNELKKLLNILATHKLIAFEQSEEGTYCEVLDVPTPSAELQAQHPGLFPEEYAHDS